MGFDEYDEDEYLRANPDVAVMVERGLFRSPLDHWQKSGSLEHAAGRRRAGFHEHDKLYDEETYLRLNPDVVTLVRKRVLGSGYEHWMRHGRVEFSRGKRHAPFVATSHAFRPFRLTFGDAGGLLLGAVDAEPRSGPTPELRHGDEPEVTIPWSAVGWTAPLRVVDALRRERSLRLLLVRLPPFKTEARRPRPLALSTGGAPLVSSRDAGMQAFFFAAVADAAAFLECALGLDSPGAAPSPAFEEKVAAFVVGRLQRPPEPREPFSGFFLESLAKRAGAGFDASGWFAPADGSDATASVWCPETGEYSELEGVDRIARPDVLETIGAASGIKGNAALGFRGFLPLPRASREMPSRLVFQVTLANGAARFFESTAVRRLLGG
ncbi:MAG TPA: hypothetical protein VHU80_14420 [Polyangiaceae bacterium]|nr:hypothetical protein [Polyangiaceae bacterium]